MLKSVLSTSLKYTDSYVQNKALLSRIFFFEKFSDPSALIRTTPFIIFLVFSKENNIFITRFEILKKQPPKVF